MWRNVMVLLCACVCFAACGEAQEQGAPEATLDEAFVAGAAPAGKADEPSLSLTAITQVAPPEALLIEGRRRVLTTPAAFTQLSRQGPPEGFDGLDLQHGIRSAC